MLTVHHLGVSQSDRIVWLCEELEIPYRLVRYDRDSVTRLAPADYKALHPSGTAPVITDGDLVLGESGAIMEYIIAKYGQGRLTVGPDQPNFADYLFWFHYSPGSMMPNAMSRMLASHFGAKEDDPFLGFVQDRDRRGFEMIEKRLGEVSHLAGDAFTAADIIMFFPLTTMRAFVPKDLSAFPNIRAYLRRVGNRPAYRRALEKGDPGMAPFLD